MSDNRTYDPYETIHKLSLLWEKQINDFIFLWTNNDEFVKMSNLGTELHSRYVEQLKKNQEMMASVLNMPTKSDVTNISNLTIQAAEKIEALEEQLWELQDSVKSQGKDISSVVEISQEIIKLSKQFQTELVKTKKELAETKSVHDELQEMKFELMKLNHWKEEFETLKNFVEKEKTVESVLSGAGAAK